MTLIPRPPSYAGTLAEWEAYRQQVAAFPADEPGREGALAEADGMIAAIRREDVEAAPPLSA